MLCKKNQTEITVPTVELENCLTAIETSLAYENLNSENLQIINQDFFYKYLPAITDGIQQESEGNNQSFLSSYNSKERELSSVDSLIYKSLIQSLDKYEMDKRAAICDIYIRQLNRFELADVQICIKEIINLRDLLIFIHETNRVDNGIKLTDFDSCWENCVRKKAEAAWNGNWFDKTLYVISALENTATWSVSCTIDCW